MITGSSLLTKRLPALLAICLAASLPYLSSAHNYFVKEDFGVVQLLSQKPPLYFPRWFVTSWMDNIWGVTLDEIRPFPAVTYQLMAAWGAAQPLANHLTNIAFHMGNALLVLAVARFVAGLSFVAATVAALVFAVLPVHAESVAWITGRVDTVPALFFTSSFLAYACWRRGHTPSPPLYLCSIVLFFCALFSKQNAITMVPTLFLYDLVVEQRPIRASWSWLAPYVPFLIFTAAYLFLRYELFGEAAREGQLTAEGLGLSRIFIGKHFQRMFVGSEVARYPGGYIAALLLTVGMWLLARTSGGATLRRGSALVLFFGPCWWLLGLAPLVVVRYETPRHVYLVSVGWAIMIGLAFQVIWHRRHPAFRYAALVASAALLSFYTVRLQAEVADWNIRASVSQRMVADLEREAHATPEGSLLIVGAPPRSWEWALPFATQPPFTRTDLTEDVAIVWPVLLDCCRLQWAERTRAILQVWSQQSSAPAVVVGWDSRTGAVSRLTDRGDPRLRKQVLALLETNTPEALDRALLTILQQVP
jgi:hypothetical protein